MRRVLGCTKNSPAQVTVSQATQIPRLVTSELGTTIRCPNFVPVDILQDLTGVYRV